jgi:hypothetical protein
MPTPPLTTLLQLLLAQCLLSNTLNPSLNSSNSHPNSLVLL